MVDPFVRQRNEYVAAKLEDQLEAKIQERIRAAETEAWNAAVEACFTIAVVSWDATDIAKDIEKIRKDTS